MSLPVGPETPHEVAAEWCLKLMSEELTVEEHSQFIAWRNASPENNELLKATVKSWLAYEDISVAPQMIERRSAALQEFRRAQAKSTEIKNSYRKYVFIAAASIILMSIAVPAWLNSRKETFHTAPGERRNIVLADGSAVFMDSDSTLLVHFSSGRRQLWLETGRANFSVAKDPLRPFTVESAGKIVVATGTRFTVERTSTQIRVVLYEGHVSTLTAGHSGGTSQPLTIGDNIPDRTLEANEELVSNIGSDQAALRPINARDTLSWETGQLVFRNEPLVLAVERVNRYSTKKVIIASNVDKSITVSGIYSAGDTYAFLDGVASVAGLSFESNQGGYVLASHRTGN